MSVFKTKSDRICFVLVPSHLDSRSFATWPRKRGTFSHADWLIGTGFCCSWRNSPAVPWLGRLNFGSALCDVTALRASDWSVILTSRTCRIARVPLSLGPSSRTHLSPRIGAVRLVFTLFSSLQAVPALPPGTSFQMTFLYIYYVYLGGLWPLIFSFTVKGSSLVSTGYF